MRRSSSGTASPSSTVAALAGDRVAGERAASGASRAGAYGRSQLGLHPTSTTAVATRARRNRTRGQVGACDAALETGGRETRCVARAGEPIATFLGATASVRRVEEDHGAGRAAVASVGRSRVVRAAHALVLEERHRDDE